VLVVRNDRRRAVESAEVSFRIDPDPSFPYDLAHLSAESSLDQIDVSWGCESERRVYGWMVYRAEDPQGPFTALTSMPLPSIGDSDTPLAYHYSDNSVQPGVLYYYQVEGITVDGLARRSAVIARRAAPAPTAR